MKPIMRWQYTTLAKELRLLQGHLADPSCPCSSDKESCVFKHLNSIEALAIETKAMEDVSEQIKVLESLAKESKLYREFEEAMKCHPFKVDKTKRCPADWARKWAKEFEQLVLNACNGTAPDAAPAEEPTEAEPEPEAEDTEDVPMVSHKKCHGCGCTGVKPKLIFFGQTDCHVCHALKKIFEKAGVEYEYIECKDNPDLCDKLEIKFTPDVRWKCGDSYEEVDLEKMDVEHNAAKLKSYKIYKG